ncbi:MAG: hypothetical protein RI563_12160 [Thiohalophilus sp.]|uniref:hypothetical protein n=1 Tax=Thiohalophilus sp. TaxID=3028392 RepID=UPI002870A2F6|nr:hypothetical protein [Thiohalophilus sp.]MDR9437626.1 hypothetical protein [Thiohalophilus sp.]
MSKLIEELKQYGVIAANEVKRITLDQIDIVGLVYKRAKQLNSIFCAKCWVIDNVKSQLEIEAFAGECNIYSCDKCDFSAALPKTETTNKA